MISKRTLAEFGLPVEIAWWSEGGVCTERAVARCSSIDYRSATTITIWSNPYAVAQYKYSSRPMADTSGRTSGEQLTGLRRSLGGLNATEFGLIEPFREPNQPLMADSPVCRWSFGRTDRRGSEHWLEYNSLWRIQTDIYSADAQLN